MAVQEEETVKPKIMSDYGYNGSGLQKEALVDASGAVNEDNLPILVMKDKETKTLGATLIPEKGRHRYAIKFFSGFMQRMERQEIMKKSDGERA